VTIDPAPLDLQVAAESPLATEAKSLQEATRCFIAFGTPGLESKEGGSREDLSKEEAKGATHDAPSLVGGRQRVATLAKSLFPAGDGEGEPTDWVAAEFHDPVEAMPLTAIEIGRSAGAYLGDQLRGRQLGQRLKATDARFGTPTLEEGSVFQGYGAKPDRRSGRGWARLGFVGHGSVAVRTLWGLEVPDPRRSTNQGRTKK
jgi:hypothetical protein